ncbi:MAG TPA: hypothetical protein VIR31_08175, partial [Nitrososphaeraceae archaeon]
VEYKSLLSSALVTVIEALRMNPDRYVVVYNSNYDDHNDNLFDNSMGSTMQLQQYRHLLHLLLLLLLKPIETAITMNTVITPISKHEIHQVLLPLLVVL